MEDNAPRIMITGGNFYGKGAEAMMLTVRDAIAGSIPHALCCAPPLTQLDYQRMIQHGIHPVNRRNQSFFGKLATTLTALVNIPRKTIDLENLPDGGVVNVFRVTKFVVDVSGFASSDQFGPGNARGRWTRVKLARNAGNKIIFMPQSWGPFRNRLVRLFTQLMLRDAELIFAREQTSYDHLQELRIDHKKIELAPDIAFQFQAGPPETAQQILTEHGLADPGRPIIGITPNMQIYQRTGAGGPNNPYVRVLNRIIDYFLRNTECRILLIPHELSDFRQDDDELCRLLIRHNNCPERIFALTGAESAADIKAVIARLDFLLASRYHSLVAALSKRVPVAVVGWSHKYDDLMQSVGLGEWVIDFLRESDKDVLNVITGAWSRREDIRAIQNDRVPELEEASQRALGEMIEIVKS